VCAFPVNADVTFSGFEIDYVDQNGEWAEWGQSGLALISRTVRQG